MAGVWEGFTDEDIGFYKRNHEDSNEKFGPKKKETKLQGQSKKNVGRERILTEYRKQIPKTESGIPDAAKLSNESEDNVPLVEKEERKKAEEPPQETGSSITGSNSVCLKVIEGKAYELVDKNSAEASKATLEIFEARQKMLEEQNKRRKEILAKVISDRKKQTSLEAKRLQHIQEELQKLDVLLSNDVGILRNKIEEASLDFAEAQKRYNKAEKEFLEAKHNLFVKLEKKELLTKLLCTIIEQNELRKAQKLSELMEKLEINETGSVGQPMMSPAIISSNYQSALSETKESAKKLELEQANSSS